MSEEIKNITPEEENELQKEYIKKAKILFNSYASVVGHTPTACVNTFGCQMNARDSEKLLGILLEVGFIETEDENADFVIYNTCTVRDNANTRVYGRLGTLGGMKKRNPNKIIALCGCMMQEPSVIEKIKESYRFVNLIFGTHNIYKFSELLCNVLESELNHKKGIIVDIWEDTDKIVENLPVKRKYSFKSSLTFE
mgnify:CR=1 FL=1